MTLAQELRYKFQIRSKRSEIEKAVNTVLADLTQLPLAPGQMDFVKLALIESVVNAVLHGNKEDPSKEVTIDYDWNESEIYICVTDEGKGFNPHDLGEVDLLSESGRGIMLIKASMDHVCFNNVGNKIYMIKRLDH